VADHGADFTGLDDDDHPQYALETLVNKKGDILVGPAADEVARLGVGTNGYVLTADSTRTSGMKWAVYRTPGTASAEHADGPISQTLPALTQAAEGEYGPVAGPIAQTLPALTQAATGERSDNAVIAQTLPALTQTATALHGEFILGVIEQTLPSLTQTAVGETEIQEVEVSPGGGVFLAPGFMQRPVRAVINQTLPALTQSATAVVNDDELVLLLLV
jgi:hypothetical protein